MKPFPKWITAIGVLGGGIGSIWAAYASKNWIALIGALGAVMAGFGHSVTGTGGSPQNP